MTPLRFARPTPAGRSASRRVKTLGVCLPQAFLLTIHLHLSTFPFRSCLLPIEIYQPPLPVLAVSTVQQTLRPTRLPFLHSAPVLRLPLLTPFGVPPFISSLGLSYITTTFAPLYCDSIFIVSPFINTHLLTKADFIRYIRPIYSPSTH